MLEISKIRIITSQEDESDEIYTFKDPLLSGEEVEENKTNITCES